jgi:hypothetical protein
MLLKTVPFLILFSVISLYPQQQKFFDAPFGGGIGYVPAWYLPDINPVNMELRNSGMPEFSSSGFYSSGISGFIYIGFIKFLRIGGMGFGGSVSKSQNLNGINREVDYSLGGGGLTVEYTLPFVKEVGISVGAVIGKGNLQIELYRNSTSFNWNGIWNEFNGDSTTNFSRVLNNNFWTFTPTLNIDWPIYRFVVLRLGAGYQFTFSGDWTADNDSPLSNVPTNLNGNSFFIQSGLFIGFFSF